MLPFGRSCGRDTLAYYMCSVIRLSTRRAQVRTLVKLRQRGRALSYSFFSSSGMMVKRSPTMP